MPCYHPMRGYRSKTVNASGKRSITFDRNQGFVDMPQEIPCGQCIGCRLERSRQWAVRCMHEAKMHEKNCFITLTYNDQNLPPDKSIHVEHFQNFMKRLRKKYAHKKIRFFHCGEYGEKFARPHYHACIFGLDFSDKKHWRTINENKLYTSQTLEELWPFGFSTIGEVTFESAAYVARYVTKKITGKNAIHHYNTINYETGEILSERRPEYVTMSRRPGIGKPWLEKYLSDVFPDDFVLMRGKKLKPPKFYNAQYERAYPSDYEKLKIARKRAAEKHAANNTRDRLDAREYIHHQKISKLKRTYENET